MSAFRARDFGMPDQAILAAGFHAYDPTTGRHDTHATDELSASDAHDQINAARDAERKRLRALKRQRLARMARA